MANRLLVIQPSHYLSKADRRVARVRRRSVVPLTLPYLAALTPPDWQVALHDEQLRPIDFDAPADLVALTAWTLNSGGWREGIDSTELVPGDLILLSEAVASAAAASVGYRYQDFGNVTTFNAYSYYTFARTGGWGLSGYQVGLSYTF